MKFDAISIRPSYALIIGGLLVWVSYMIFTDRMALFQENWPISLTMLFGSFIAGASSEGGGAIAFPVFTLLFELTPDIARNFSFAIQSVGMTAASIIILDKKIKIEKKAILYSSLGGVVGLVFGTFYILGLFDSKTIKMAFVSLWLSFGMVLFIKNNLYRIPTQKGTLHMKKRELSYLVLFGFIGGIVSSIFGNGLDMVIFCFLTLFFKLDEKIATPTSVVIMSINTVFGFILHLAIVQDYTPQIFDYWLVSVPVVILFAPIGALVINQLRTGVIAGFLMVVVFAQFIGALIILKPDLKLLTYCLTIVFIGLAMFLLLLKAPRPKKIFRT